MIGTLTLAMVLLTPQEYPKTVEQAVLAAYDDECRSEQTYVAIMAEFGERNPFKNIRQAEIRHQQSLIPHFKTYKLTVPENRYARKEKESEDSWQARLGVPKTFKEALGAAIQLEKDNVKLYDAIFKIDLTPDLEDTFEHLRWASQERHLPAFERAYRNQK